MTAIPVGKGEIRRTGKRVAILAFGAMLKPALEAGEALDATVVNMRFVKPLDAALVRELANGHELLVTVEEHQVMGGAGSAVCEALAGSKKTRSASGPCRTASSTTATPAGCLHRSGWTPLASRKSITERNVRVIYSDDKMTP